MPGQNDQIISAPQSPLELPEVTAVVRATHLSCPSAGQAQKFAPVRGSSRESRLKARMTHHAVRCAVCGGCVRPPAGWPIVMPAYVGIGSNFSELHNLIVARP
jgi:hypothetical protein